MLYPVSRSTFRWSTPDPNDNWLMIGHLLISGDEVILVDPPMVPGLTEAVSRLGKLESVILTTGDHIRGSVYLESRSGAHVYIPDQSENDIDEISSLMKKKLGKATEYKDGENLPGGVRSYRAVVERRRSAPSLNEMMLLTPRGELLAGDIAMGSANGELLTRNEFYYEAPEPEDNAICLKAIERIIRKTEARTLLSSHGYDLVHNLQQALSDKTQKLER